METSLTTKELSYYIRDQLNYVFPDNDVVLFEKIKSYIGYSLERLDTCLSKSALKRYKKNTVPYFNHLFSDTYMLFLCYLSNTIWKETNDPVLSSKVYYLNKVLHSFDCMYDNKIPDIFLIIHGIGTMMGKANYSDYFVIYQGCTIGASHGIYPNIGFGVTVTSNSSIIGECDIGDRVTVSTRTTVFQKNIPNDSTAFINLRNGSLEVKESRSCYTQQFFNTDLNF